MQSSIFLGLLIIAVGAFCQSSSYVPINKIKKWSWESYWLIQGVFAWLVFPLLGALLAVPSGHSLFEIYAQYPKESLLTMVFGVLWGIGGLTFGLSMRYLGVALGQSIALGTCAGLGAILGPLFTGQADTLTAAVWVGVVVTLVGIAIIAVGHLLNLVMGILSVVVHGVRLNLLEFSGALGMEWTGYNYEPFRKMVNDKAAENS